MIRGLGLALAVAIASGTVAAQDVAERFNDYPTEARADYVFACMATNGQNRDMLRRCSCSIDEIAAILPYEKYLEAQPPLQRGLPLIAIASASAPLLGLLGTVTGMIETFDSLATMQLFSRSGGIAGGVAQALVSTQMGLAVAIPGVLAGKMLDDRQHQLEGELDELLEVLCSPTRGEVAA